MTSSRWASRRCSPATPTSSRRSGAKPWARERQRGTRRRPGRSAVPAATTSTRPARVVDRLRGTAGSRPAARAGPCSATTALAWSSDARVSSTGAGAVVEQLADDAHALLGRLARPVHRLRHALAQGAVVVDEGVADVGERQPPQPAHDLVGVDAPGGQVVEQRPQRRFVHARHAARHLARIPPVPGSATPIACPGNGRPTTAMPATTDGALAGRVLRAVRHVHRAGAAHAGRPRRRRARRLPDRARRARRRRRRRRRLRRRADRELDRGRRQLHPGRAGLRLRPADHPRDRARHRALPRRRRRASASTTSRSCCRSPSPPRSATASCASTCASAEIRAANSTAEAARLVAEAGGAGTVAIAPRVAADALRARRARRRHRRPPRQPDPLRASSPATASRRRPATTARRWSCSSGPTSRAA